MVVRIPKFLPAVAAGAAAFTVFSGAAVAFFPPVPVTPAEVATVPPVPVVPVVPVVPLSPPSDPGCHTTVPPTTVPVTPQGVPEPATILSGLTGLSLLGAAAARRRLKLKAKGE